MKNLFRRVLPTLLLVSTITMANFASADPVDGGDGAGGDCSDPTVICSDPGTGSDGGSGDAGSSLCGRDELLIGPVFRIENCKTSAISRPPLHIMCPGKMTSYRHYQCRRPNGTLYPAPPGGTAMTRVDQLVVCEESPFCN